jgi:hypothetical protein
MGAAMTPATSAITEALPQAQQGVGSALNDLSREVGGALGTAVIGSIVTAVYRSSLTLPGAPAPVVDKVRASFAVGIHVGGSTGVHARDAFINGIHTGLLYAAGSAILAAISVAILLHGEATVRRPSTDHERRQPAETAVNPAPALTRCPFDQPIGSTIARDDAASTRRVSPVENTAAGLPR